jgi:nicotinate-nucleotide adenylyltransferase
VDCFGQWADTTIMSKQAIGILGGTFDPVHFGHLRTALDVLDALKLDHIRFIPNSSPPHRDTPVASAEQRSLLLNIAVKNCPQLIVDERELHREGPSYTIDTLKSLRADFPDNPLFLLVGIDAFEGIQTWYEWEDLLSYAHIAVMNRPDAANRLSASLQDWVNTHRAQENESGLLCGRIWEVDVTQFAISSTKIREKLNRSESVNYLMPDSVIQVIEHLKLYQ